MSDCEVKILWIGNTINFALTLTNAISGNPDTGATIGVTIQDAQGQDVPITGVTWPVPLVYVAANEKYLASVKGHAYEDNADYKALVMGVGSEGQDIRIDAPCKGQYRC